MAIVAWTGNGQQISQVVVLTITGVATGGVLSVTMNGKVISYTCLVTDTTTTAAAALAALLGNSSTAPPEFNEQNWAASTNTITATAQTPGQPFTMTSSGSGGATLTQATTQANVSQSSAANAANYLRLGVPSLPQPGDDFVLADSAVPILWDLLALANIPLNSFTRWQSFTATVGLPENNPGGYYEYRPTYLKLLGGSGSSSSGSSGPGTYTQVMLGVGQTGSGPSRERYDFQGTQVQGAILNSGSAADDYAIRILNNNTASAWSIINTSVGIAMLPNESAIVGSAQVDSGGTLALGPAVTFVGALSVPGGTVVLNCAPASVTITNGGTVIQGTVASSPILNYPSVTAKTGSTITWLSGSNINSLILQTSSNLDKSQDLRPMQLGAVTMDADTCTINDPYNTITWTGQVTLNNNLASGPIILGTGRSLRIT
jgi:hypothetical protein